MSRPACVFNVLAATALAATALAATALTGCGPPPEVRIGILAELSVPDGGLSVQAAQLAVDEANKEGGVVVDGRKHLFRLVVADAGDSPESAVEATLRLVNRQRVAALVGSNRSRNAIPQAEAANAAHVPFISPSSSHPDTTAGKPYAFRVVFTDPQQGLAMARVAREDLQATKAAVLYNVANDFSRSVAEVFIEAFARDGGDVVAETYTDANTDVDAQLKRLAEEEPDVLLLPAYSETAVVQGTRARELGITATFLGVDGWMPAFMAENPLFEGALTTESWNATYAESLEGGRAFRRVFREFYGEDPVEEVLAIVYDAARLLVVAIRDAGTVRPEAVRDALASIEDHPGATGRITFRGTEGDPSKAILILRIGRGQVDFWKAVEPKR